MFCPKCGNQNLDEAQFCRSCGVNLSLVPHALTGQLPVAATPPATVTPPPVDRRGRPLSKGQAVQTLVMGFGFAALAFALAVTGVGRGWWFWMLIPCFAMLGKAISMFIQVDEYEKRALPSAPVAPRAMPPFTPPAALPARNTGEFVPQPFSVTEATTRHLSHAEAPTRVFDPPARKPDEQ